MHELSLALNIIDIVGEECRKAGSQRVEEVVILVGTLSGVDTDALSTSLHVASRDTVLQNARIQLNRQQGKGYCDGCKHEFFMEDILSLCPLCFQPATSLTEGEDMRIESIVVD
jgi:hydrogenase nickel incorporation protein HypA/HybF